MRPRVGRREPAASELVAYAREMGFRLCEHNGTWTLALERTSCPAQLVPIKPGEHLPTLAHVDNIVDFFLWGAAPGPRTH